MSQKASLVSEIYEIKINPSLGSGIHYNAQISRSIVLASYVSRTYLIGFIVYLYPDARVACTHYYDLFDIYDTTEDIINNSLVKCACLD